MFSFGLQVYIQDLSCSKPELKLPSVSSSPIIDPHISPDGTMISFVRDRELHILHLLHNEQHQLTDGAIDNAMVSLNMDTMSFLYLCVLHGDLGLFPLQIIVAQVGSTYFTCNQLKF